MMTFIELCGIILFSAALIQTRPTVNDEAWKEYQVLKSTLSNATLQSFRRLRDLQQNNLLPSVRSVVQTVETDMTEIYFYKLDKMDSIAKVARDKGVDISGCLHDHQESWLDVWQTQMAATGKINRQALEQMDVIVSQMRNEIRRSLGPVFDDAAALAACAAEPSDQEVCLKKMVHKMDTYLERTLAKITKLVDGVDEVMVPVFSYMYLALITVSTEQAIQGREAVDNVTACANDKKVIVY